MDPDKTQLAHEFARNADWLPAVRFGVAGWSTHDGRFIPETDLVKVVSETLALLKTTSRA